MCPRICIHFCLYSILLDCAVFLVMSYICSVCLLLSWWLLPVRFHRQLQTHTGLDFREIGMAFILCDHKGLQYFESAVLSKVFTLICSSAGSKRRCVPVIRVAVQCSAPLNCTDLTRKLLIVGYQSVMHFSVYRCSHTEI